ncbi:Mediator complex subunit 1 [Carabus blaptoides fortunei]
MNDTSNAGTTMGGGVDKPKEWQMELLMEKLRSKTNQFKSFAETSKAVRMNLLEKRYQLDSVEKNQHQKCLDTLQHSIKVTSLQSMVERLESLTRQLGLKFMLGPSGVELFISSEMFYLEVVLDPTGAVRDVKVHHEGKVEQQSCIELVNCLSRGDFADFTAQLEGLSSIYQINAEKKIKCKTFSALQALETDLSTLAQLQTFIKEPSNLLHKSPVGILEKRKGGHAMKLTYFVSPYDLLDKDKAVLEQLTVETVTAKSLGYSVTVCIEGSNPHKLQTTTIISVNRNINGKNTPSYAPLSNQNSAILPACFVLRLNKPLPMCVSLVRRIQQITDMECGDMSSTHPLMSLTTQHVSAGKLDCAQNKGLFVTLPDQHHCYFMTESKSMDGILVNNIPFSHPCHVPQILVYLRQQALFNSVVASCIRPYSKQDLESMIMFEVSALSWQHLSISLEHPLEESMATAELDLSDISNVNCKIYTPTSNGTMNQADADAMSELATKVFQRCLSIPITMRAVIKLWDEQINRKNHLNGNENFSLPLGAVDPGGHNGNTLTDFGGLDGKMKHEHGSSGGSTGNNGHSLSGASLAHAHQGMFLNESLMTGAGFSAFPGTDMLNNMEISSLLSGTVEKSNKRQHKRKASEDLWKNPKRKASDDNDILVETSSSDSTSISTPTSHDAISDMSMATPNSALGFHSDLELSGLDAPELINASEKTASEYECSREADDVEEILAASATARSEHKVRKSRDERKATASSLLSELAENKGLVPPSVSITPITSTPQSQGFSTVLTGMGLERRPGIEIIPITSTPATSLPSSITITPISTSHNKLSSDERRSDKKSSKSRSDEKSRLEKKRKRKRDEAPMGPPDKLPPKQDPLSKPVSVSIKPAESPPLPGITPTSPSSMLRKFSSSPTHGRGLSLSGKSSPSMLKPMGKSGSSASSHHSPKHSPAHVMSSPKHTSLPGISSPKNHGTSPKHTSAGGTGKPSMSTLKSAASSPSSKSTSNSSSGVTGDSTTVKVSKSSKDASNRDKEKKPSSSSSTSVFSVNNPKVKSSSVKLKQLDLSATAGGNVASTTSSAGGASIDLQNAFQSGDSLPSPSSGTMDLSKASSLNQVRNRKGSLSAVIDKLKSAQHCGNESDGGGSGGGSMTQSGGGSNGNGTSSSKSGNRDGRSGSTSSKLTDAKNTSSKVGENKNSEYMVKPSSDGIKITINKTRTKESTSSKSSSSSSNVNKSQSTSSAGTGSPKTHTGLKPGVNSGPASKKPQQINQKSSSSSVSNTSGSSSSATYSVGGGGSSGTGGGSSCLKSNSSNNSSSGKVSSIGANKNSTSSGGSISISKSMTKLTGSPKTGSANASELTRNKDGRPRLNKSSSDKSIFSSSKSEARRSSPTASRDETDSERAFKLLAQHSKIDQAYPTPLMMEGMIKSLDTNFQIPKLSARTGDADKKAASNKIPPPYPETPINNIARTVVDPAKMYDMITKTDIPLPKYPLVLTPGAKPFENNLDAKNIRNNLVSLSNTSPLPSNPFITSSSPKLNMSSATHLKELSIEQAVSLATPDLTASIVDTSDSTKAMQKVKDLSSASVTATAVVNSLPPAKDELSSNCKLPYPISATKTFPVTAPVSTGNAAVTVDSTIKPPLDATAVKFSSPQHKPDDGKKLLSGSEHLMKAPSTISVKPGPTSSQEAAEILLDFSTNSMSKPTAIPEHLTKMTDRTIPLLTAHRTSPLPLGPPQPPPPPPPSYPASPSVSVHIVKSPAPSPLVNPSPHSASPCITDDELMDEALVGLGK